MTDPASQSLLVNINLRPPLNAEEVLPDEFESFHQPDEKHRDVVAEFLAYLAY